MSTVTVTWLDGKQERYQEVQDFELADHWLHIHYRFEEYSVPLAQLRTVLVESA